MGNLPLRGEEGGGSGIVGRQTKKKIHKLLTSMEYFHISKS